MVRSIFRWGLAQAREAWFGPNAFGPIRAPSGSGHLPQEQMNCVPREKYSLPPSRAFLLFEVMVAVTIVGIGLAAVLQSLSFSLGAARVAKEYFSATSLLSGKLWEITSVGSTQPGSTEGAFKNDPHYRYRILVEEVLAETPVGLQVGPNQQIRTTGLAKVSVTVSWDTKGKPRKLVAETYLPIIEEEPVGGARYVP